MTTITHLPDELIVLILENKNISVEDIVNLKYTCKRLQHITFSTNFWKKKYYHRFSSSNVIHSKKRLEKIFNHVEAGVKSIEKVRHYVSLMSSNNLKDIEIMELNNLLHFIAEHSIFYHFVIDDIIRIISAKLPGHDLTIEYYFSLICRWLKQYRLVYKYTKFICMPKEKLLLEKLVTIIVQYFQPCVSYSIIDSWLNTLVQIVLFRLNDKNPTHSIFSTSPEQFDLWKDNNFDNNFWNPIETEQIKYILEEIISSELSECKLHQLLVTLDFEEKFINCILKDFRQFLLAVMYHSIARRLGLRCFLNYNLFDLLTIIWELKDCTDVHLSTNHQTVEYIYIKESVLYPLDVTKGLIRVRHPLHPLHNLLQVQELIFQLSNLTNISDRYTDLQTKHQVPYKSDSRYILEFLLRYLREDIKNIRMDDAYISITRSIKERSNFFINEQPKLTKNRIKFAVGMIVTHSPFQFSSYQCELYASHDGVIIGWHYKCEYDFVLENLKFLFPHDECQHELHLCKCECQIGKSGYSRFNHQPHYLILAENNKFCYAPEDTIHCCPPKCINNVEIGRYFSKFEDIYYIPNENLARNYPIDITFVHKMFFNQQDILYRLSLKDRKVFKKTLKKMCKKIEINKRL